MIVFVEKNRLGRESGNLPGQSDHLRDSVGIGDTVAVDEQEIRSADDVLLGNGSAAGGRAGENALSPPASSSARDRSAHERDRV